MSLAIQTMPTMLSPEFSMSLASWRTPSRLDTLGHAISKDGPPGVIHDAHVAPVDSVAETLPASSTSMPLVAPESVSVVRSTRVPTSRSIDSEVALPVSRLPVVEQADAIRAVPSSSAPTLRVEESVASGHDGDVVQRSGLSDDASGETRRLGAPTPDARRRPNDSVDRSDPLSADGSRVVDRSDGARGLGLPVRSMHPDSRVIQRESASDAPQSPVARIERSVVSRSEPQSLDNDSAAASKRVPTGSSPAKDADGRLEEQSQSRLLPDRSSTAGGLGMPMPSRPTPTLTSPSSSDRHHDTIERVIDLDTSKQTPEVATRDDRIVDVNMQSNEVAERDERQQLHDGQGAPLVGETSLSPSIVFDDVSTLAQQRPAQFVQLLPITGRQTSDISPDVVAPTIGRRGEPLRGPLNAGVAQRASAARAASLQRTGVAPGIAGPALSAVISASKSFGDGTARPGAAPPTGVDRTALYGEQSAPASSVLPMSLFEHSRTQTVQRARPSDGAPIIDPPTWVYGSASHARHSQGTGSSGLPSSFGGSATPSSAVRGRRDIAPEVGGSRPSAGDVAVASGIASWSADGAVVFGDSSAELAADRRAIQRSVGAPVAEEQRSHADGEPTDMQLSDETYGRDVASAAPLPSASTSGELDELAHRLYSRIRLHLRSELRLDRERAGAWIEVGR